MSQIQDIFDVRLRVAMVTGAASGIGLAIAEVLAENGAIVGMADVDEKALAQAVSVLAAKGGKVEAVKLDVSDREAVARTVLHFRETHGSLDIMFANAGISAGPGYGANAVTGAIENTDPENWDRVLKINLTGVFATVKAAATCMKPQGAGSIIVTASTAGLKADPVVGYAYAAAKAAVVNLVRQSAVELAAFNVRVNAIAPGPFMTNIAGGRLRDKGQADLFRAAVPLGRIADPSEIRGLALLLASKAGSFMTGAVIPIDGGVTAR